LAHRYGYELQNGPISAGLLSCHHCDNPPCVRGTHLFAGTSGDNSRDMSRKGRGAVGDRNAMRLYPEKVRRGSQHQNAKLVEADVAAIRALLASGVKPYDAIASRFGVSTSTIGLIARGKMWRHVA
jgi:hypothetical protein